MFKVLFKMHGILSFSGCLLKMQKLILNDTENVSNKSIYFRTSFLGRNQNFSWNSYFPTINLVLLNLYYLLANTFAADIFLLVLLSEVEKQISKRSYNQLKSICFLVRSTGSFPLVSNGKHLQLNGINGCSCAELLQVSCNADLCKILIR